MTRRRRPFRRLRDYDQLLLHLDIVHGIDPNTVEIGDEVSRHEQEHERDMFTTTPEAAAAFERHRAEALYDDDRPTLQECEAEDGAEDEES